MLYIQLSCCSVLCCTVANLWGNTGQRVREFIFLKSAMEAVQQISKPIPSTYTTSQRHQLHLLFFTVLMKRLTAAEITYCVLRNQLVLSRSICNFQLTNSSLTKQTQQYLSDKFHFTWCDEGVSALWCNHGKELLYCIMISLLLVAS